MRHVPNWPSVYPFELLGDAFIKNTISDDRNSRPEQIWPYPKRNLDLVRSPAFPDSWYRFF
jgi:hypothetical protein